jgi:tetratricopeptide (TPR) repeat protein
MRTICWVLYCLAATSSFSAVTPSPAAKSAYERGEAALAASKLDDAAKEYQEALKASPGFAPALNGLGSVFFKQKKVPEAIAQFRQATQADATFKLAWFNLGYAARKSSDFIVAVEAYEKYTALDAADPDGFYGLAESYKGASQNEKAIAAYELYLKKETRPTEQKWTDKAKETIASLKAAVVPVPVAAPVRAPPAAVATTTPAPEPAPVSSGALLAAKKAEGDKFFAEKKYREASFAFQEAVKLSPDDVEALFKMGNSYAKLGYYPQAIEQWSKIQNLSTDAAVLKLAAENISKAQSKIVTVVDAGTPTPSPTATVAATTATTTAKPPAGALTTLPTPPAPRVQSRQYYEGGVQLITQRRYGEALNYLNESVRLEPSLTVGYVARGSTLIGLRRFSEAAVDYQYALKLEPTRSDVLYGLAEAYRGMNRPDEARTYYQRYAASTAPDVRPELQTDARNKLQQLR